jgi:hypothetical protein
VQNYPTLVQVPGYPVYYAPDLPSNYFFYDGLYWLYQGDDWYASSWYNGPWDYVAPESVPYFVLRVPVRYYRRPPVYFGGWQASAAPRWNEHWGSAWSQQRQGWDQWDRRAVPAAAPLPVYQRQYSGNRYPQVQQQQALVVQQYHYQPRDAFVAQRFQAQRAEVHAAPAPAKPEAAVAPRPDRRVPAPPPHPVAAAAPQPPKPALAASPQLNAQPVAQPNAGPPAHEPRPVNGGPEPRAKRPTVTPDPPRGEPAAPQPQAQPQPQPQPQPPPQAKIQIRDARPATTDAPQNAQKAKAPSPQPAAHEAKAQSPQPNGPQAKAPSPQPAHEAKPAAQPQAAAHEQSAPRAQAQPQQDKHPAAGGGEAHPGGEGERGGGERKQ